LATIIFSIVPFSFIIIIIFFFIHSSCLTRAEHLWLPALQGRIFSSCSLYNCFQLAKISIFYFFRNRKGRKSENFDFCTMRPFSFRLCGLSRH
jgi:hypothetical protein